MNRLASPALLALVLAFGSMYALAQDPGSSLLLLVDASGSRGDPVGSGNPQSKIDADKSAATVALGRGPARHSRCLNDIRAGSAFRIRSCNE